MSALIAAAKLTLLFHEGAPWDETKSEFWGRLTTLICEECGIRYRPAYSVATTKTLCDMQWAALAKIGEASDAAREQENAELSKKLDEAAVSYLAEANTVTSLRERNAELLFSLKVFAEACSCAGILPVDLDRALAAVEKAEGRE